MTEAAEITVPDFHLSRRSYSRLEGVNPDLVRVVERAIKITAIDFAVIEGGRTEARQRALVKAGASQTMRSKHLTGDAVDLAAWFDGEIRWDLGLYYPIAIAMRDASSELGITLTWGGSWSLLWPARKPGQMALNYAMWCERHGRAPFIDAGHFEVSG